MAEINHAFVAVDTNQTTTSSTYEDVPGAAIDASAFVAGKKYLIVVTAQVATDDAILVRIQTLHGTTAFAESEQPWRANATTLRWVYQWMTVWTAIQDEGIKIQFANTDGAATISCNFVAITAINLSDDLIENTDWMFAEHSTDDTLSTDFLDGATITFTPRSAGHDWLVLTYAQIDPDTTVGLSISRIDRSGEAASILPEARLEATTSTGTITGYMLARVFNLGAASNTFKEQAATSTGTSFTRLHSAVFAIDLNKFRDHATAYTEGSVALSATNYATELQSITMSPTVTGDVWFGGWWHLDVQAANREGEFRLQESETDTPAGQTSANYQFAMNKDNTEDLSLVIQTVQKLTAVPHTIAMDASADATVGGPSGRYRTLWAVTMELADGPLWGDSQSAWPQSGGLWNEGSPWP